MAADGWKIESKGKEKNERKGRKEFWPKEKSQKEEEIEELKGKVNTDEYIEKTAREKLGMVKDNEILFKESQSK